MTSAEAPTVSAQVDRWDGSGDAIRWRGGTWSWRQMRAHTVGAASVLRGLVVTGRPPTPALLGATPAAYAWVLGGAVAGRPLAPLGVRLAVPELVACVSAGGSGLLLADEANAALASAVGDATGIAVEILSAPPREGGPLPASPGTDDVAYVVHTSGTSGVPKPVAYRQGVAASRGWILAELCGFGPGAVYATSSPFHHVAGFAGALAALGAGATVVPVDRFSVEGWRSLGELGVTHALLVPTMIDLLLDAGALLTPALRVLIYGAAPMPSTTLQTLLAAGRDLEIVQLFGQTEGTPLCALGAADHRRASEEPSLLETAGQPVVGVELRLHDPDERGVGEVWARGKHLAWVDDDDGWLHTGDLGALTDSYLRIHGRTGDRIVRGGENIDPLEVEVVLQAHPAVRDVAVAGVPDDRWGQCVTAWVVLDPGAPESPDDLRQFARSSLAGFKVPTTWHIVDELPRSAAGKVLRRALIAAAGGVTSMPMPMPMPSGPSAARSIP